LHDVLDGLNENMRCAVARKFENWEPMLMGASRS
jgi:hypothetical protein